MVAALGADALRRVGREWLRALVGARSACVRAVTRYEELTDAMCGIVGIVGTSAVNQRLYDALTVLQHRGQDAAGIVTSVGRASCACARAAAWCAMCSSSTTCSS